MRVLLLSTPYPLSENVTPPLGLAYLAASLRKDGFEVEILDFLVSRYRPAKLVKRLDEFRPHFVGATCVTLNFHVAARMLKICKEFDQSILFRGHSHSPQMIRQVDGKILRNPIHEGEKINLTQILPCIITCGALTEGLCMIWDQEEASLACLSFPFK